MTTKRFKTWKELERHMHNCIIKDERILQFCPEYINKLLSYGGSGAGQAIAFDKKIGWAIVWCGMGESGIDYLDKGYKFVQKFIEEKITLDKDKHKTPFELENEHLKHNIKGILEHLKMSEFLLQQIFEKSENNIPKMKELIDKYKSIILQCNKDLETKANYALNGINDIEEN